MCGRRALEEAGNCFTKTLTQAGSISTCIGLSDREGERKQVVAKFVCGFVWVDVTKGSAIVIRSTAVFVNYLAEEELIAGSVSISTLMIKVLSMCGASLAVRQDRFRANISWEPVNESDCCKAKIKECENVSLLGKPHIDFLCDSCRINLSTIHSFFFKYEQVT